MRSNIIRVVREVNREVRDGAYTAKMWDLKKQRTYGCTSAIDTSSHVLQPNNAYTIIASYTLTSFMSTPLLSCLYQNLFYHRFAHVYVDMLVPANS